MLLAIALPFLAHTVYCWLQVLCLQGIKGMPAEEAASLDLVPKGHDLIRAASSVRTTKIPQFSFAHVSIDDASIQSPVEVCFLLVRLEVKTVTRYAQSLYNQLGMIHYRF
jgi:hypothetical protein